jgi:hypothetical protein
MEGGREDKERITIDFSTEDPPDEHDDGECI